MWITRRAFLLGALALLALSSVPFPVEAAGPSASLSWTTPATNTDGSPITGALTFNLYQGSAATASACTLGTTAAQTGISATTLTVTSGLTDGTTACFAVTAVEGGVESAKSNVATKTFPAATPSAPTGLTAQ